jgi:hypothetical protein
MLCSAIQGDNRTLNVTNNILQDVKVRLNVFVTPEPILTNEKLIAVPFEHFVWRWWWVVGGGVQGARARKHLKYKHDAADL